jgi:hypothetical protein
MAGMNRRTLSLLILLALPLMVAADMGVSMSAMRRTILGAHPVAYWPLEDEADSTSAGPAVGGQPLTKTKGVLPVWASDSTLTGSAPVPDWSSAGSLAAPVSPSSSTDAWTVEFAAYFGPGSSSTSTWRVMEWMTGSERWYVVFDASTNDIRVHTIQASDSADIPVDVAVTSADDATWHHYRISAVMDGLSPLATLWQDGVELGSGSVIGSAEIQAISNVKLNPLPLTAAAADLRLTHVAVYDAEVADHSDALDGYTGELAHVRIARLCGEENIPYYSVASTSPPMGPQPAGTLLTCLREAEDVDQGVLYERAFGLAYQSRAERENQPVSFALDFNQSHIVGTPRVVDDDRYIRNRWTISRSTGSESTYEQTTGPLGSGANGARLRPDGRTINVETDDQLLSQASYRVHRDTVDEDRWQRLDIDLAHSPDLIPTYCALPFGARFTVANPPSQLPPDTADLTMEGRITRWDSKRWTVAINATPAIVHHVFTLAAAGADTNPHLGYLIPTSCVLAEDLDTTETDVDITTTPLWSTNSDDWAAQPRVVVGGEIMRVTAVSGASNPQTLTVVRSVNTVVKTHSAGAELAFYSPGVLSL